MVRMGMVGLGKMGLSHLAIVNSHPRVKLVAACDTSAYLTDALAKYTGLKCYAGLERMLAEEALDAVVVSTPSKLHATMVEMALERGLHVFCEKPFVLDVRDGERLASLAESKGLATQVGYHLRFVGAFQEAARVVASGALGEMHHVRAECYGPVVLRPKGSTWRSAKNEGGGALYDYACHAIDLAGFIAGSPVATAGAALHSVFSRDVEDEVYCTLHYANGATGQLAVNWSDESFRKMSAQISVWGSNGRLSADRQECRIYLREAHPSLPGARKGWTVRYTTELTDEVWYYLRGEEYSAQIDYFVASVEQRRTGGKNNFHSALQTDRVVAMIADPDLAGEARPARAKRRAAPTGLLARLFG